MHKLLLSLILFLFILFSGCGVQHIYIAEKYQGIVIEKPADDDIVQRVLLIGDAGEPSSDIREPVLDALEIQAMIMPQKTVIVFLGDNIYPYGLDDPDSELRIISESRLNEQIKVGENSKAHTVFVPGNHDWDQGGRYGWAKIIAQEEYVKAKGDTNLYYYPGNGCPGPVIEDFPNLRMIYLDTQWWLHPHNKPTAENSNCDYTSEDEVIKAIENAFETAEGRFIILNAHHPLATHGPHGGYFPWIDHIFPLLNLHHQLWLPLPIIGSLYPLARILGITPQDLMNGMYQNLIAKMENALKKYDNWTFAAGHEHSIQVLEGVNNNYYLISGFGTSIHHGEVTVGDNTVYADNEQGFMQVDILKDGKARLAIYQVDEETGNWIEIFTMWLNDKS